MEYAVRYSVRLDDMSDRELRIHLTDHPEDADAVEAVRVDRADPTPNPWLRYRGEWQDGHKQGRAA